MTRRGWTEIFRVVEGIVVCVYIYMKCVYSVCWLVLGEFLVSDLSSDDLILSISEDQTSNSFTLIINVFKCTPRPSDSIPACSCKHGSVVAFLPFIMAYHSSFAWQSEETGQE